MLWMSLDGRSAPLPCATNSGWMVYWIMDMTTLGWHSFQFSLVGFLFLFLFINIKGGHANYLVKANTVVKWSLLSLFYIVAFWLNAEGNGHEIAHG